MQSLNYSEDIFKIKVQQEIELISKKSEEIVINNSSFSYHRDVT